MGKRMTPWRTMALLAFLNLLLTVGLVFKLHAAEAADPLDLGGRTLVMVEGYGARCAVLYTHGSGIGNKGSGSISCWPINYRGDWRRAQPRSE